ncbi:unnamed protein product, partial [Hymenolepis diminuta]
MATLREEEIIKAPTSPPASHFQIWSRLTCPQLLRLHKPCLPDHEKPSNKLRSFRELISSS